MVFLRVHAIPMCDMHTCVITFAVCDSDNTCHVLSSLLTDTTRDRAVVNISGIDIGESGAPLIARVLKSSHNLASLNCHNCHLKVSGVTAILKSLMQTRTLEFLSIGGNVKVRKDENTEVFLVD